MKYEIKIIKIVIQCLLQCYPINHRVFLTLELHILGFFTLESLRNKQLDLVFKPPSNLAATSLSRLSPSLPYGCPYVSVSQVLGIIRRYHTNLFVLFSLPGTSYASPFLKFYLNVKAHFKTRLSHRPFLGAAGNALQ